MKKKNNSLQFIIITVITFLIVVMFIMAVNHFIKLDTNNYSVGKNSITYDAENNYIKVSKTASLKMGLDGNYKLINNEDMLNVTYNLGTHAIIKEDSDISLNIYGTYYEVKDNGEISRLTKENKITT